MKIKMKILQLTLLIFTITFIGCSKHSVNTGVVRGVIKLPILNNIPSKSNLFVQLNFVVDAKKHIYTTRYKIISPNSIKGEESSYVFANLSYGDYWLRAVWDVADPFLGNPEEGFKRITEAGPHPYKSPGELVGAFPGDYYSKLKQDYHFEITPDSISKSIDIDCTNLKN